jgi:hypothetical protein
MRNKALRTVRGRRFSRSNQLCNGHCTIGFRTLVLLSG